MRGLIASPFGYTDRESRWLEHVVLHAGVFCRRQYLTFIGHRGRGAVDQRFLSRLTAFRHATVLPYHHRECVFHLTGKPLYEWFGHPDLRHRRPLAPHRLAQKLMLLDVTLCESGHRWLATEQDKVRYFTEQRGLSLQLLPSRVYRSNGHSGSDPTTRYFVDRFPILVQADGRVGLVYPDFSGHVDALADFLKDHATLLRALADVEVVYVTDQHGDASRAEARFRRQLGLATQSDWHLLEDLVAYCATREALDQSRVGKLSADDLARYRDRCERFQGCEYEKLYDMWRSKGPASLVMELQAQMKRPAPIRFRHLALPFRYYCLGREAVQGPLVPRRGVARVGSFRGAGERPEQADPENVG